MARLEKAISQGDWARHEREHLYRERDRWRKRAEGKDARFEVVGNRPGRITDSEEAIVILLEMKLELDALELDAPELSRRKTRLINGR